MVGQTSSKCPLCGENLEELEKHVETAHGSRICKICKICSLIGKHETKCMKCGKILESTAIPEEVEILEIEDDISEPVTNPLDISNSRKITGKEPMQCSYCKQWFQNRDASLIHQVIVHGVHYCHFCEEVFVTKEEKLKHNARLHAKFSCEQCDNTFDLHTDLLRHRGKSHKMFGCNYCDYMFSMDNMSSHHVKSHRIIAKSAVFSPYNYYDSRLDLFSTSTEKYKFKCELCEKILKTSKLINHVKYFHNFSNFSLIESFKSTAVNFNFNDNTLSLERKVPQSTLPRTSLNQIGPRDEYTCEKCNIVYQDGGAHYLFQHEMRRCRLPDCNTFFENDSLRDQHEKTEHKCSYSCSVCSCEMSSQYSLVTHRKEAHNMQTCIFCDSMILTAYEPFANHLSQHHYIRNLSLIGHAKVTPVVQRLINSPLIIFNSSLRKVECNLCDSGKFDCVHGGEEFVRHLMDFHHIKNPSRTIFPLFNGNTFCYQTLKNSDDNDESNELNNNTHEKGEIRKKIPKKKNLLASKETKYLPNHCIVCGKGFSSSEEVQMHLLANHTSSKSETSTSTSSQSEEIYTIDAEVIEKEKEDVQTIPIVKIETDDSLDSDEIEIKDSEEESDIQIDEEHYSINHVQVSITEQEPDPLDDIECSSSGLEEKGFTVNEAKDKELEDVPENADTSYEENIQLVNMTENIDQSISSKPKEYLENEGRDDNPEIVGDIGKSPVYLTCDICGVILTSILNFTNHMKKFHKDSEQERNKPFKCDICSQGFYFQSSLNSHKSKAHQETTGQTFRCPLCTSVTNSKNGMRRHLRNSHKRTDMLNEELSYKCKLCDKLFWSMSERTVHIAEEHKEASENLEKCFICAHISPNKHALRRHFQRMHPTEQLFENVSFKCDDCGALFPQKHLLSRHMKSQHPKSITYQCAYCPEQLKTKKALQSHINQHKKSDIDLDQTVKYTCNVCDKEFSSKKALKTHFSSSHSEKGKKGFSCKVCNKVLDSANDRSLHYKIDHPDSNPYLCSICGLGFITKSSLYNHRMCHKSQKQHKCEHCGKEFNRRDSFNEHVLIHVGPRHKCPHCAKEFVQKSNLKRHVRIHLGIKPYKCTFCEMTFSDKGACNSHQRTHTGEEREACPICNVVFSKKQKLKYHMRIHTGEGLETCHICSKSFTHSYALNVHLKTHSKENHFMCHFCQKTFQNGAKLYRHVLSHGKSKFECKQCSKSFKFSKLLNRHVITVHEGLAKLECSFEQCNATYKKLWDIREHIRESHSVKNPVWGTHFKDGYNDSSSIDKLFDPNEIDLAHIYEALDIQMDNDVIGKPLHQKDKVQINGKINQSKTETEEDDEQSDVDVKEEPMDEDFK